MPLEIVTVPCLSDNYAYLLRDAATGTVGLVDAPEAGADRGGAGGAGLGARPHPDHPPSRATISTAVDALRGARRQGGGRRGGPRGGCRRSTSRWPRATRWRSARASAQVLDVPGHTVGHIAYYFAEARRAVLGGQPDGDGVRAAVRGDAGADVGEPEHGWRRCRTTRWSIPATSTRRATRASRCRWTAENAALKTRATEIAAMRQMGGATVPARLDLERATNPFLRAPGRGFQGPARAGEIAGCPSFRRDPPPQGCFLSRRSKAGRRR